MKKFVFLFLPLIFLCSCQRTTSETWEDVKTAGRYIKKSFQALIGKEVDESRQFVSADEFSGPQSEDFIPLEDSDIKNAKSFAADKAVPQPKVSPGDRSGKVPGMDQFIDPPAQLASVFRLLHFETDNHVIKEKEDLITIARIANYMKKNPNSYLIIEGHCDKRASADYNLALGMRRAQHIRVLLSKQGVDPNRLYTVSYGKEKPLAQGDSKDVFFLNRRAQFKLFAKK